MPNQYTALPMPERFWSRVDQDGAIQSQRPELGSCWIWTGARRPKGYGLFSFQGRMRGAHVVAYILTTGHEPPAETPIITHLCDGGAIGCVRPSHLKADTTAGNLRGMVERGRAPLGRRNGQAKLSEDQVREIRQRKASGETYSSLESAFGITRCPLWRIVHRKHWSHIS